MAIQSVSATTLVGKVVLKLTQVAEEDLPLVVEFVDYLAHSAEPADAASLAQALSLSKGRPQQQPVLPKRMPATLIRAEARRRAQELKQIPRTEIVTRFRKLAEEIRQTAIAKDEAIEGDWLDD